MTDDTLASFSFSVEEMINKAGGSPEKALISILKNRGLSLACAESCTGGLVCDTLVSVPGASAAFTGGTVCYQNRAKEAVLGVKDEILAAYSAVSPQTAEAMVRGCASLFSVDCAVSVTGVAGPPSENDPAPVGMVFFGILTPNGCHTVCRRFPGDRASVRHSAANEAIRLLLCDLLREKEQ